MTQTLFPTIDLKATGENIIRLRKACGLTVREIQCFFGFEEPQAIYKWQQGKCLPSVDNLFALSTLLGVSMNEILVQTQQFSVKNSGQSIDCPFSIAFFPTVPGVTGSQSFRSFKSAFLWIYILRKASCVKKVYNLKRLCEAVKGVAKNDIMRYCITI